MKAAPLLVRCAPRFAVVGPAELWATYQRCPSSAASHIPHLGRRRRGLVAQGLVRPAVVLKAEPLADTDARLKSLRIDPLKRTSSYIKLRHSRSIRMSSIQRPRLRGVRLCHPYWAGYAMPKPPPGPRRRSRRPAFLRPRPSCLGPGRLARRPATAASYLPIAGAGCREGRCIPVAHRGERLGEAITPRRPTASEAAWQCRHDPAHTHFSGKAALQTPHWVSIVAPWRGGKRARMSRPLHPPTSAGHHEKRMRRRLDHRAAA